jgi:hypothetical protein
MARVENRRALLEMMPKGAVCAEIGVWDGGFSEVILEVTEPAKLHLIDPWLYQPDFRNSAFGRKANIDKMDDKYTAVKKLFEGDDRIEIHRALSHAALESFEDGALDWVYIDGNHNYDIVSVDIALSLQKVKPDGIISGDDLFWNPDKGKPVATAVRETLRKLGDAVEYQRFGQQWFMQLRRG